jgi:hypothetical protein
MNRGQGPRAEALKRANLGPHAARPDRPLPARAGGGAGRRGVPTPPCQGKNAPPSARPVAHGGRGGRDTGPRGAASSEPPLPVRGVERAEGGGILAGTPGAGVTAARRRAVPACAGARNRKPVGPPTRMPAETAPCRHRDTRRSLRIQAFFTDDRAMPRPLRHSPWIAEAVRRLVTVRQRSATRACCARATRSPRGRPARCPAAGRDPRTALPS